MSRPSLGIAPIESDPSGDERDSGTYRRADLAPLGARREAGRRWEIDLPSGLEVSIEVTSHAVLTSVVNQLDPEQAPLVVFSLIGGPEARLVRVTSRVEGYSATSTDTIRCGPDLHVVMQLPTFFEDRIRVAEATAATLHVEVVELESGSSCQKSFPVRLLARTTGLFVARFPPAIEDPFDPSWLAAFVTPNDESVIALLPKVAACHADGKLIGEPTPRGPIEGRRQRIESQVKAVYRALQQLDICYVDSRRVFGVGGDAVQRIRLPRETLSSRCGNCADRTVLFASLLEAIGLCAGLAFIDSHTFVAWRAPWEPTDGDRPAQPLVPAEASWDYVDTTLIESSPFEQSRSIARTNAARARSAARKLIVLSLPDLRARGIQPMG